MRASASILLLLLYRFQINYYHVDPGCADECMDMADQLRRSRKSTPLLVARACPRRSKGGYACIILDKNSIGAEYIIMGGVKLVDRWHEIQSQVSTSVGRRKVNQTSQKTIVV